MKNFKAMRDFGLEVFFSKWEFTAKHHMTASDVESLSVADLLQYANDNDKEAYEQLWLGYTETWGAPDLRDEIARTYAVMQRDNILCLAGAGEGLYMLARVLLTADDHVIVPIPNYQSAETVPLAICSVSGVPMHYEGTAGWRLDVDDIKSAIKPNTKLISLNFPHNPTGMLLPRADLDALVSLCREHGIYLLSDEVYRGVEINPADQMPQIADVYERGLSLNVMSKAYGLPALRVGWFATQDKDLLLRLERYKHYLSICNSGPSERLSVIALKAREKLFARNHAIILKNLALLETLFDDFPSLFEWSRPMGGCVAFPKYLGPEGGEAFCQALIEKSGVLLLPSSIYVSEVSETPENHFRIGIGRDTVFDQGIVAMRQHLEDHHPSFAR